MKVIETDLKDCYEIEVDKYGDSRGYYSPFFVEKNNITNMKTISQCARSMSNKGIVRGLHFQKDPLAQAKLVECLRGAILDVVVDLRKDSPTYLKSKTFYLIPENNKQIFIPRGFAHGFVSLEDNTLFQYLVDNDYSPIHEDGILWNDPELGIDWQLEKNGIKDIILSEKDKVRQPLSNRPDINIFTNYKYLITGCNGQLGYEIVRQLNSRGIYDVLALDIDDMDITDSRIVNKIFEEYRPKYVFHCAAYTNVDAAENNEEMCRKINVDGTKNIVEASRRIGAKLMYISTDYVFDGKKEGIYKTNDATNPLNVYGKTKLEGEKIVSTYDKHFIVRTSWVFGINGKNFVKTMLNLGETRNELGVVCDQIGSPTYAVDLANLLVDMHKTENYGLYHATNEGFCSWSEFAKYIFKSNNRDVRVNDLTTAEYGSKTLRPLNSKLSKQELIDNGLELLPTWQSAVDRFNLELEEQKVKKLNL